MKLLLRHDKRNVTTVTLFYEVGYFVQGTLKCLQFLVVTYFVCWLVLNTGWEFLFYRNLVTVAARDAILD